MIVTLTAKEGSFLREAAGNGSLSLAGALIIVPRTCLVPKRIVFVSTGLCGAEEQ